MNKALKLILFGVLALVVVMPFSMMNVNAVTAIKVSVGDEEIIFGKTNEAGTATLDHSSDYGDTVLTLSKYDGEKIVINCYTGSGSGLCSEDTSFIIEVVGDNKISADDFAIISNIDVKLVGNGNLVLNAPKLRSGNFGMQIGQMVSINVEKDTEETNESSDSTTEKEEIVVEKNTTNVNDTIVIISVVANVLLSLVIVILLVTSKSKKDK